MADVNMVFKISKAAIDMIRKGQAVLSSGGVRLPSGELFELAKPSGMSNLLKLAGSPIMAPVQLVSSLGSNVQSAFIQHGVNLANIKLDDALKRLASISSAMQGLQTIQVLSWVNSLFTLANCGISIAGFKMTFDRLDGIKSDLRIMFETYKQDRQTDKIQECENLEQLLNEDLVFLLRCRQKEPYDNQYFENSEFRIQEHLIAACNYLRARISEAIANNEVSKFVFESIYRMTLLFAQVMNEFCCQYYYVHNQHEINYHTWFSIFNAIDQPEFKKAVNAHLVKSKEYFLVSPLRKKDVQFLLQEAMDEQKERVLVCHDSVERLSLQEYLNLDQTLCGHMMNSIMEACPDGDIDRQLSMHISEGSMYETTDGQYAIPVQLTV